MAQLTVDPQKIKVYMALQGIDTNEELARAAQIGPATLYNLMNGDPFRSSTLEKLANALGVNPLDLLDVTGEPSPHMGAPAIATI